MTKNVLSLLDELRGIATEGLTYAKDKYDIDRYSKLMEIVSKEYAEILGLDSEEIKTQLRKEVGCITPKLGTDVAIIKQNKELLILRRTDDNTWSLPCGWVDVGEKPFDTAIRESKEESGLDIVPLGYIAITEKGPHLYPKMTHQVNVLVVTQPVENDAVVTLSHEHSEYKWINKEEVDKVDWHPGHERLVKPIFAYVSSSQFIPHVE